MEALGTVIDFEDGVAKFKILDLHDYPLYTLKATVWTSAVGDRLG